MGRCVDQGLAPGWRRWGAVLALAAAYAASGRLGLLLAENHTNATLVWAPTGLSLAAMVLYGWRLWPGVFAGALLVNLSVGTPVGVTLGIAVGNTLEAVAGLALLRRLGGIEPGFGRASDVLRYLLAAFVCTLVSASIGVLSLWLGAMTGAGAATSTAVATVPGAAAWSVTWIDWWLGDLGGAVVVGPILLVSARGRPDFASLVRRGETWGVLPLVAITASLAFGADVPLGVRLPVALAEFPLLLWAGLRLGPRGAMLSATVVAVVAFLGAATGAGPFAGPYGLYMTLAYAGTIGTMASLLAAAIAEREEAEREHDRERDERLRVEAQLHRQQRLEELGVLAGGVAHDFNNLLVPIFANAELLRDGVPAPVRPLVDDILAAAGHARDLSGQLLTYAGKQETTLEDLDLAGLAKRACSFVKSSLGRNVRLTCEAEAPAFVRGDPALLKQLFVNLVLNASEAAPAGGGVIRVGVEETGSPGDGGRIAVTVADDGCGMSAATRARLFDPFFTTKEAGRGLGLSAVDGIVRLHGGGIVVDSAEGRGATFQLTFPSVPVPAVVRDVEESSSREAPAARLILVADDEEAVRRTVVRLLEFSGYDVVAAVDGEDALEQFDRHADRLSLVLLDVTMPGKPGTAVAADIRERDPRIPVVLMSGFTGGLRGGEAAADLPFVAKPFTVDELFTVIDDALDRAGAGAARLRLVP